MQFLLDSLLIQLDFNDPEIEDHINLLFYGWQQISQDIPESVAGDIALNRRPDCIFRLEIIEHAVTMPQGEPLFQEITHCSAAHPGLVSIFQRQQETIIHFEDGAIIQLSPDVIPRDNTFIVEAKIERAVLQMGRLEDILYTGLAPILRRRGYFLVHAFAATYSGRSILLVGPSNSGKTTAGLALTAAGWGYLANDIVVLKLSEDDVYALPAPGAIGLSGRTLELIPKLRKGYTRLPAGDFSNKRYLPALDIVDSWSQPAPVGIICFPTIFNQPDCQLKEVNKAIALARMLESSVDRWDQVMLEEHFHLSQRLVEQADNYELLAGDQIASWSDLLV